MKHLIPTRTLTAAAAALFAGGSAQAVQIDTFADSPAQIVASQTPGAPPSVSDIAAGGALGGNRKLTASGGTGAFGTLGIAGDGLLQFANTPSSAGNLTVRYLPGGVDLTAGGDNGFLFTIEFADAPVDYEIRVVGFATPTPAVATGTLPTDITGNGDAQDVFIPFTDLSHPLFVNNALILEFEFSPNNGVLGADLSISNLRTGTVPEPSSLALLGLGGLALARRRRR